MTVSNQTSNETFYGNGITTTWDLPFRFFSNTDIFVYLIDPVAHTTTPLLIGTDYTLTGAGLPEQFGVAPGKIITTTPVANGKHLYVERIMAMEQLTDVVNQGRFFPEVHEDVFDRLTMLIQQHSADSKGAIRVAIGDPEPARLVSAAQRAGLLMAFDSNGDPVVVPPSSGSATDLALLLANEIDVAKGAAVIGRGSQVVQSIANLKTLSKTSPSKNAFVTGYYSSGDGGGGHYYLDQADTTSADNGGTIIVAADGGRWKLTGFNGTITTKMFGSKADGSTDDTAAFDKWVTVGLANRYVMVISKGVHKITQARTLNLTSVATVGITIRGEGTLIESRLDFSSVPAASGTPFTICGDLNAALFYINLERFAITTNYNGVGFRLGRNDLTDAFNEGKIDLWVNNNSQGASPVSMEMNHVLHNSIRLVCNGGGSGRPGQPLSPGFGTALIIRQAIMNNLMLAVGNANKGLYITGGFTYGNMFGPVDIEEVNYGLIADVSTFNKNTFVGGQWLALNLLNVTAGSSNKIINPNIALYSGGTKKVSVVGLHLDELDVYDVTTPAIAASGTYAVNNTGHKLWVYLVNASGGSSLSGLNIKRKDGTVDGIPIGTNWGGSIGVILAPDEAISPSYTGSMAWNWRAI